MENSNHEVESRPTTRASLACVQCRSRHLRCDGGKPICSRCQDDGSACNYMKSRRGGRRRAQGSSHSVWKTSRAQLHGSESQLGIPTPPPNGSHTSVASSHTSSPGSHFESHGDKDQPISERLVKLYYRFFHPSHPCVLPLKFLEPYRSSNAPGVPLLMTIMQYVGSLYATKIPSDPWREQCEVAVRSLSPQPTLFEVQALLIYAITSQWTNFKDYAHALLGLAIDRALVLGMHRREFSTQEASKLSIYAESCRRTWWDLYLANISMCAIDRIPSVRLSRREVECSVDLPCSEEEYETGVFPDPRTLQEWDEREFADEPDTAFSSFAYYISLYRGLDFCLYGMKRDSEESVKRIATCADAGIATFRTFCSATNRSLMSESGKLDSYIFKANFGIVVYTAEIHRFLSTIKYHSVESLSSCTPPPPPEKLAPAFVQEAPIHTAKILQATESMIDLLTLPINLLRTSPFTVCQIATPTVALISACKSVLVGDEVIAARDRIRVAIAAIEKYGEVWPRAATTARELKAIAREIFGIKKSDRASIPEERSSSQAANQMSAPQDGPAAMSYQEFEFFNSLATSDACNFGGFSYDSAYAVPSTSAEMVDDASAAIITMAY